MKATERAAAEAAAIVKTRQPRSPKPVTFSAGRGTVPRLSEGAYAGEGDPATTYLFAR